MTPGKTCGCVHHKIVPILTVLFALTFLFGAFDVITDRFVEITWPILVGLAGLMKMSERMCKCC